jgi:hypothetical protein
MKGGFARGCPAARPPTPLLMLVAGAADLLAGCSEMRRLSAGDEHGKQTSAPRPSERDQKSTC